MKQTILKFTMFAIANGCFLFTMTTLQAQTTPVEEVEIEIETEIEMEDAPIFEDMDIDETEITVPVAKGTMTSSDRAAQKQVFEHYEMFFDRSGEFKGKYSEIWRLLAPHKYKYSNANRLIFVVQPSDDSEEGVKMLRSGFDNKNFNPPRVSYWISFDKNGKGTLDVMLSSDLESN